LPAALTSVSCCSPPGASADELEIALPSPPPAIARSPMITVGQPVTMTPPCAVRSPIRAACCPHTMTDIDPLTMTSVGPVQISMGVPRAGGGRQVTTVGQPGGMMGPPTCGTRPVTIGQVCISVIRAAGGIAVHHAFGGGGTPKLRSPYCLVLFSVPPDPSGF